MKNQTFIRVMALILALVMALSCLAGIVMAAEPVTEEPTAADLDVTPLMTLFVALGALAVVAIGGIVMLLLGRKKK